MTSELIERMLRERYPSQSMDRLRLDYTEEAAKRTHRLARSFAKAHLRQALKSLREPTADMVKAGLQTLPCASPYDAHAPENDAIHVWQDMIDAALQDVERENFGAEIERIIAEDVRP